MVRLLIIYLLFCIGCSSPEPLRKIASDNSERYGEVDTTRSTIRVFPEFTDAEGEWYNLYVQLRDGEGQFVDCAYNEIVLFEKDKSIPFKLERVSTGRYYLILNKEDLDGKNVKLSVQRKKFKDDLKLFFAQPHRKNSKIRLIEKKSHMILLQLHLADEMNRPVILHESPEIILEGLGEIGDLKQVRNGVWEFFVIYPDDNQIMYFSVRALGAFLPKIYRYQHIEK